MYADSGVTLPLHVDRPAGNHAPEETVQDYPTEIASPGDGVTTFAFNPNQVTLRPIPASPEAMETLRQLEKAAAAYEMCDAPAR